jgi:hypothetical protein
LNHNKYKFQSDRYNKINGNRKLDRGNASESSPLVAMLEGYGKGDSQGELTPIEFGRRHQKYSLKRHVKTGPANVKHSPATHDRASHTRHGHRSPHHIQSKESINRL